MKVYISGPMHGLPDDNFPAFNAAAAMLRARGHTVYNPAEHDREHYEDGVFNRRKAITADLQWIGLEAEVIAMLPGWERSTGAMAEFYTAKAFDLEVMFL